MGLTIELRNDEIVLVEARLSKSKIVVKKRHTFNFDEEMVNASGVIDLKMFSFALSQQMKQAKIKGQKCVLCLNNTSIMYRELSVPKVDERRIPFLVKTEMMSALNLTNDYIIDFAPIDEVDKDGVKMHRVLAVAVLESAIGSYVNALKRANLKVEAIDSATNAIIKMMNFTNILQDSQQAIVADVQNGILRLYLFDQGVYVLTRNTRISKLTEDNRMQVISEMTDSISKMSQYTYSRKNLGIGNIYYVGKDELLEDLKNSVTDNLEIHGDVFSEVVSRTQIRAFSNKDVNALGALLRK
jgi:Tfp pilus assembly PilM family ATPase